jgi:hypothetical protein
MSLPAALFAWSAADAADPVGVVGEGADVAGAAGAAADGAGGAAAGDAGDGGDMGGAALAGSAESAVWTASGFLRCGLENTTAQIGTATPMEIRIAPRPLMPSLPLIMKMPEIAR